MTPATLKTQTVKQLCEAFKITNDMDGNKPETSIVRGWIIDELQKRDSELFDNWLSCGDVDLMDNPANFFFNKFIVNERYSANSICDSECSFNFTILKRTPKTITIQINGHTERKKIFVYSNVECVYPLGRYSMAPLLRASNPQ
jgi:hypothetical protein